jgi:LmbE family N-acetylglucosaminyl deacetylase
VGANEPGQPPVTRGAGGWSIDLDPPPSALAIGAHPDDVEFGGGGTLAKWAVGGCVVHHLVLTDGSKGTWDTDADIPALVAARQREQRAAAEALGGRGEVVFLGEVDGELEDSLALRSEVARWIRMLRPAVVMGHDPWKRYRLHPDHRVAGFVTCDAIVAARDPHFFREHGLDHHRPSTLLLWEADEPDHAELLDEGAVVAKLAALEAHESQFESTMHALDHVELDEFRSRIRRRLVEHGALVEQHRAPSAPVATASVSGSVHAEVFKRIDDL